MAKMENRAMLVSLEMMGNMANQERMAITARKAKGVMWVLGEKRVLWDLLAIKGQEVIEVIMAKMGQMETRERKVTKETLVQWDKKAKMEMMVKTVIREQPVHMD
jgi:hypothetical protein